MLIHQPLPSRPDEHLQPAIPDDVLRPAERFSFTGSGSEYFRIWIVNLLLTIATLGIYSAWAKVRKLRYFYANTHVAGASFDYHGTPLAILKGRVVAVILIAAYQFGIPANSALSPLILLSAAAILPWLLWKSLQFRLHNSSYRAIRFNFRGNLVQAYTVFLLWPAAAVASAYLLAPLAHHRIKRFQHTESRFGATFFRFSASTSGFYGVYLGGLLLAIGGFVAIAVVFGGAGLAMVRNASEGSKLAGLVVMASAIYLWAIVLFPIILTMVQKLVWNATNLGQHRFANDMTWRRVIWIAVTNMIGIALTLGLFLPFAQIRMMRYRIESLRLLPHGSLNDFIADAGSDVAATGEGVSDLLDLDISL